MEQKLLDALRKFFTVSFDEKGNLKELKLILLEPKKAIPTTFPPRKFGDRFVFTYEEKITVSLYKEEKKMRTFEEGVTFFGFENCTILVFDTNEEKPQLRFPTTEMRDLVLTVLEEIFQKEVITNEQK